VQYSFIPQVLQTQLTITAAVLRWRRHTDDVTITTQSTHHSPTVLGVLVEQLLFIFSQYNFFFVNEYFNSYFIPVLSMAVKLVSVYTWKNILCLHQCRWGQFYEIKNAMQAFYTNCQNKHARCPVKITFFIQRNEASQSNHETLNHMKNTQLI